MTEAHGLTPQQANELAALIHGADQAGQFRPVLSNSVPLDLADAYRVQRAFLQLRLGSDAPAGFKAGMTAVPAQKAFGMNEPACGVLYADGAHRNGARLEASGYRGLMLETELGFRLNRAISAPVLSVEELKSRVAHCLPVVELAAAGFGQARFTGPDIVASNLAAAGFIEGVAGAAAPADINEVRVTLQRDGEALYSAAAADVMGNQWLALKWLVNAVVARGYRIEAGQLLITGSIGLVQPGVPGSYRADYGAFGEVEFEIV